MNRNKLIICAIVLFISCPVSAEIDPKRIPEDFKRDFPILVVVSPEVQKKMDRLTGAESKRFNGVRSAGEKFMQHYLDGYVCGGYPDSEFILDQLVNTDAIRSSCDSIKFPTQTNRGRNYTEIRELCPQVLLADVSANDQDVSLTYQLIQLGTASYTPSGPVVFGPVGAGRRIRIVVTFDSHGKAYKFVSEDWDSQTIYLKMLFDLEGTYTFHGLTPPTGTTLTVDDIQNLEVAKQVKLHAKETCK